MSHPELRDRIIKKIGIEDGCWIWKGGTSGGRPRMVISRDADRMLLGLPSKAEKPDPQSVYVRRVSWVVSHGAIPEGQFIIDTCGRKMCINPWHLMLTDKPPARDEEYHEEPVAKRPVQPQLVSPKILEQIFRARKQGMSLRQIAEKFGIAPSSIRWHLRKINRE